MQLVTPRQMMMKPTNLHHPASFRDPSGFLFHQNGILYRQVNASYQQQYDLLMSSGLYARLLKKKMLIPHSEVDIPAAQAGQAYRSIQPEPLSFISYPYEWSFSQLKDAALLTLAVHKLALESGMALKDASAYNIQFQNGRPVLIDTLSFEIYHEDQPWVAYRQFCQHFLAPLALMAYQDVRLSQLLRVYIDGIPLDLASRLLPARTRLNLGVLSHLHLHASAQKSYADSDAAPRVTGRKTNRIAHLGLIENLESTLRGLKWQPAGSEWADYYDSTNYTRQAFDHKAQLVGDFIQTAQPQSVWDLGSNTGVFSRIAAAKGIFTVSADIDPAAVEKNYLEVKQKKEKFLLPLLIDLTNPSPAIGWGNQERDAFMQRSPDGSTRLVMALALVHHLAISNNVPLPDVARFFARLGEWLVVEFIPKEDSQVQRLLRTRVDIFPDYHAAGFESAFCEVYDVCQQQPIEGSKRILYLMKTRSTSNANLNP
jgi:hypothetical protein